MKKGGKFIYMLCTYAFVSYVTGLSINISAHVK